MIQTLTNMGVIIGIVVLVIELGPGTTSPAPQPPNAVPVAVVPEQEYVDVAALKCPSSYDDETQQFRTENYWLFQKRPADRDITMVLRPDRNTGTWNQDVNAATGAMIMTPDILSWTSYLYEGNFYTLNRKDLSMERQRQNRSTVNSQCERLPADDARTAVTRRYQDRLEGNRI